MFTVWSGADNFNQLAALAILICADRATYAHCLPNSKGTAACLTNSARAGAERSANHAATDADSDVILKYVNAVETQNNLPKLKRQATLRAWRRVSPTGKISYETLEARDDGMVRREVIARYLATKSEAGEMDAIAITPAHYTFRFARTVEEASRRIQVFQLTPKRRRQGLFRGELWLDSETGLPIHESGRFIKNPSVFVKRILFVRDYQVRDGIAIPNQIAAMVDTRLVGRADLTMQFSNIVYHEALAREGDRKCR